MICVLANGRHKSLFKVLSRLLSQQTTQPRIQRHCQACLKGEQSFKLFAQYRVGFYTNHYIRTLSSSSKNVDNSAKDTQTISKEIKKNMTNIPSDVTVKVQPTIKKKRQKTDFTKSYTDNVFITPVRALNEYLLKPSDLESMVRYKRRSAYADVDDMIVYRRRDVEQKALEVWKSMDRLAAARAKEAAFILKQSRYLKEGTPFSSNASLPVLDETEYLSTKTQSKHPSIFKSGPGKVVLYAVTINGLNCLFKLMAWIYTGSHSMFAELIHSVADTANQIILAVGLHQSHKSADMEHPYGWSSFKNVASLISGVGIFCLGAGVSFYHGIVALINPMPVESLYWGMAVLAGSFISEGATLMVAVNEIRRSAKAHNMGFREYVWRGMDPSTNVVLLEDTAAVLGVTIAGSCMMATYYTGYLLPDALGSLLIGSVLWGVASFIIYTNTIALVGRSIPWVKQVELMQELESDRMIRALHDVKATEMGANAIKFKAEVDFDGREITRLYLENLDLERLSCEMQSVKNVEDVEAFILNHGENIVDTLGSEVDRIEKNLKKKHPDVRHVDLEQL